MGGQGVLAIPNVYNGWIDATVTECGVTEDPCSQEIIGFLDKLTPDQKEAVSKIDPVEIVYAELDVDPEPTELDVDPEPTELDVDPEPTG